MKKYSYAIGFLALFTLLFLYLPAYFEQSEASQKLSLGMRDLFFKIRHFSSPAPNALQDIVIVTIDEESCQKLGARWPWSRKIFAVLIDQLTKRGAMVVGLNVSFTGSEGEEDLASQELARALREHGNAVIGATFGSTNRLIEPDPPIAKSGARFGYLEKIVDADYSIRRSYLLRPYASSTSSQAFESSFPLQLVSAYFSDKGQLSATRFDEEIGLLVMGVPRRAIFLNQDGSYTINYRVQDEGFKRIPAWKVVQGVLSKQDLGGKVALVGLTSSLFSDQHPTPLGLMSGIAIHANEFLSLIEGRQIKFVPNRAVFFIAWAAGMLVLALFLFRRFWFGIIATALILFGLFVGAQFLFKRDLVPDVFILVLGPLLGLLTGVLANSLKLLLENKGLENRVAQDKLTGLYTYDFLRLRLGEEWRRCEKSRLPVTIVMTDLDRFKKINDTLGHEVGNDMIRRAAAVIKESVRGYDVISRYGGDEFVILLWHATFEEARAYRERLRNLYHAMAKKLPPELQESSISIGIATFDPGVNPDKPASPQALIEEADKDLFLDKETRRKDNKR